MPNPPFQPLTLSVEEWQRICRRVESSAEKNGVAVTVFDEGKLIRECEAQAQAADSLQRDHELLQAENTRIQKYAADLEAQLAQAQQERDALVEAQKVAGIEKTRAEQAEAALEEMRKILDGFEDWLRAAQSGNRHPAWAAFQQAEAELQRRRSAPGQEQA